MAAQEREKALQEIRMRWGMTCTTARAAVFALFHHWRRARRNYQYRLAALLSNILQRVAVDFDGQFDITGDKREVSTILQF